MQGFFGWLKHTAWFVVTNGDAFIAILVAACVIAAEAFGEPSPGLVDSAMLALLGAIAIAILRDRGKTRDLDDLRRLAEDAVCERPYVVAWQENHWDLTDRDHARVTCTEQLRFTRQKVSENWLESNGPGTLERVDAKWRRGSKDQWVEGKKVYELVSATATKEIFSFNDEHSRGDEIEWRVERDIVGQFPGKNEGVAVEAATRSDYPRSLRVTFPEDARPTRVEIREGDRQPRPLRLRAKDSRSYVEARVSGMKIGEIVKIDWSW